MSRFVNLEFNHESEGRTEPARAKDEAYYLAEAQGAFEQGRFESALRAYGKVLEHNPQAVGAWTGQVRALIELGEYPKARQWADKALERFSGDAELLSAKAVALARGGDLQGALAFSDAAVEERGQTPYVWLARGDVMLARAEQRADYCFDKALALAPRNWFVAWLAARIRYFYEQFAQALRLVRQALEWNPGQSSLWLLAGLCQREVGLTGAARTSLDQARQLDPRCVEAAQALRDMAAAGWSAKLRSLWRRWISP
ncbi:MAG: tetratricopeptide repeat protein [Verrucomicrobia bacterium]|nr:tetratricopeptide repeat protein [Verrucomicrobiota bacterium]